MKLLWSMRDETLLLLIEGQSNDLHSFEKSTTSDSSWLILLNLLEFYLSFKLRVCNFKRIASSGLKCYIFFY